MSDLDQDLAGALQEAHDWGIGEVDRIRRHLTAMDDDVAAAIILLTRQIDTLLDDLVYSPDGHADDALRRTLYALAAARDALAVRHEAMRDELLGFNSSGPMDRVRALLTDLALQSRHADYRA